MRKLIAGNWKMNGTLDETRRLLLAILGNLGDLTRQVDLLVIPPFTALQEASLLLRARGRTVRLGAQNVHFERKGAFTGEISVSMLLELGVTDVLIGHSERRIHFGETGALCLKKLQTALGDGLAPILCIGEQLAQRDQGQTESVLEAQLHETFLALREDSAARVTLAYEPVWAIGTGRNATPAQAEEAHRFIRSRISTRFGEDLAREARILYGGSVNALNAGELLSRPGVDGALVGGASLTAQDFLGIVRAAASASSA